MVRKKVSQFSMVQELVSVATAVKGPPDQFTTLVVPESVPVAGMAENKGDPATSRTINENKGLADRRNIGCDRSFRVTTRDAIRPRPQAEPRTQKYRQAGG